MSIASLGIVGGLAGSVLPQRAAETDKAQREAVEQSRTSDSAEKAASAAGIGQTEEDAMASERDADGRRPWEEPARPPAAANPQEVPAANPALAKDPSGTRGNLLDLLG
jgi:hypothetical protein